MTKETDRCNVTLPTYVFKMQDASKRVHLRLAADCYRARMVVHNDTNLNVRTVSFLHSMSFKDVADHCLLYLR